MSVYFTGITTYIYISCTELAAQSVERWSRDPGSRIQFPVGGLGVAFFEAGPSWVLRLVST